MYNQIYCKSILHALSSLHDLVGAKEGEKLGVLGFVRQCQERKRVTNIVSMMFVGTLNSVISKKHFCVFRHSRMLNHSKQILLKTSLISVCIFLESQSISKRCRLTNQGEPAPGPHCESPELPEGLPEVVQKGFNDIPDVPIKSPFILRRTTAQVLKKGLVKPKQSVKPKGSLIPKINRNSTVSNMVIV